MRRARRGVLLALCMAVMCAAGAWAIDGGQLRLVAADGTFLGTLGSEYDQNSIYNTYGNYGSPYSASSVMNKYSNYGNEYSNYSPFNRYTNDAPLLYDAQGNYYGRVSMNRYASDVTQATYSLALQLYALQQSH